MKRDSAKKKDNVQRSFDVNITPASAVHSTGEANAWHTLKDF